MEINNAPLLDEDKERFRSQKKKVFEILSDREPHTKYEIAKALNIEAGSVGSRIRDLRFDGYLIERKRVGRGLHTYQLKQQELIQTKLFEEAGNDVR